MATVKPIFSSIVAMTRKRVIGKNNDLPWHLPEDLAYFKKVTMGCPIVMGRKTFESIGRPLPGRENIIVTRNKNYSPNAVTGLDSSKLENTHVVHSLGEAKTLCEKLPHTNAKREIFLIGGAQLFQESLDLCDRHYITWIEKDFEGDTFFPEFELSQYIEVSKKEISTPFAHSYCVYERPQPKPPV